ncbi:MAG TPA: hypothetical protein VJB57_00580 [Dehalococcoidia bacterium]|nr:hypothetical protein [Dehalococcoidia bacterium]
MRHSILRVPFALGALLVLTTVAAVVAGSGAALANERDGDVNVQRFVRNAGINAVSPCNGESVGTMGLTTVVYDVDRNRRGLEFEVEISYVGSGVGDRGNGYRLEIEADRDLRRTSGGDAYNGYFDVPYRGTVEGPDRLSYKVSGTWRVFIVNGQALNDAVLTLRGDCIRDRHDRHDRGERSDHHRSFWDD